MAPLHPSPPRAGRRSPRGGLTLKTLAALPGRAWRSVQAHPVVSALLLLAAVLWLAFGIIIGGAPEFTGVLVIVAALAVGASLLLRRRARRSASETTDGSPQRLGGLVVVGVVAVSALVVFGLAQLVPFGRPQSYAAGTGEPAWSSPRTRELMVSACYDCHSNEVEYPWYSSIAPVSWTVQRHIDEGRGAVNYSNFATDRGDADDSIKEIRSGSMPPGYFTAFGMHPEARLSEAEKAELIAGLEATPGIGRSSDREERTDKDDD